MESDLVALLYNEHTCKVNVVPVEEVKGLGISLDKITYDFRGKTFQIGIGEESGRRLHQDINLPDIRLIGVYDSLNIVHLEQMANDAIDAHCYIFD